MIKQTIIVRTDLNMRKGKMCAQVAHASMKVFFDRMVVHDERHTDNGFTPEMLEWMNTSFVKIVVGCNSEQDLFDLKKQAEEAGIVNALILDEGRTEFYGKKTFTCLAVGPDLSEKIDLITKDLKLL